MSVPIEFFNLVIRRSSLDRFYPGGSSQFLEDYGPFDNRVRAFDNHLVKLGAMNPRVIEALMTELENYGLKGRSGGTQSDDWLDFCIVDELLGINGNCYWLAYEPSIREARYEES